MNVALETALFNSMSTVAETLAGAMGLLGAIVLFALQATARSIERAAASLTEIPQSTLSPLYLSHLLTRRSYHELARVYGELLSSGISETHAEALLHYSALAWELDHDHALRRAFWTALRATGAVVAFAFICGAIAPQLAESVSGGRGRARGRRGGRHWLSPAVRFPAAGDAALEPAGTDPHRAAEQGVLRPRGAAVIDLLPPKRS